MSIKTAELLSVGTELLLGEIIDTNSAYLAQDLSTRGVDVYWSGRVGDNLNRISHAIEQALERSDLLIMCGGLGPTDDDMSREAIAKVVAETPYVDHSLEQDLRQRFAKFSSSMPEKNLKQAWLIPSATALANPRGTAPGWLVKAGEKTIVALPGPPRELTRMWQKEAIPHLSLPNSVFLSTMIKTYGIGESKIAEDLGNLTLQANPSVATYAKIDGVHIRIAAKAATEDAARALLTPLKEKITALFKPAIWGRDKDDLAEMILRRLAKENLSLASYESFTGGLLAQKLSAVAKNPLSFQGGMVACNMQANAALGFMKPVTEIEAQPSEKTVLAMAEAAAQAFKTDIGVATAKDPSQNEESLNIHLAVHSADKQAVKSLKLPPLEGSWLRERGSYAALFLLWSSLNT